MHAIGLDIGTTTLSAVLVDALTGEVRRQLTRPNPGAIPAEPWARLQDPGPIWDTAWSMLRELLEEKCLHMAIGLTGQMHGMLYADDNGYALSPLYTWQDGRGDLVLPTGESYARRLSDITNMPIATGYAAATHFYMQLNGLVPEGAASIMTIQDYIGIKLTRRSEPLTHISNAASFGAPRWPGIARYIHQTRDTQIIGRTRDSVPVAVAIGDNQASFIGAVKDPQSSVLVNIGTGGQISMATAAAPRHCPIEMRPHVDDERLLVSSSLCGGRAYALLEQFFRSIARLGGGSDESMYEQMNRLAEMPLDDPLNIDTTFLGTRDDPTLRGAITGLCDNNFTPAHFVQGTLQGMVDELHAPYRRMIDAAGHEPTVLVGSGNGLRKNPALQRLFSRTFGIDLVMPAHEEEAAYGAALFALAAIGMYPSVAKAQSIIRYAP